MADRVGQQLGNYRLVRLLGQGGFADVYLGEHLHLGTQAAIKVLHTHLASQDLESFRKEAQTIARLVHPHIVRLLDFDVENGMPFLVMAYAPNGTLRRRHPRGLPLLPATILPYVKQVAGALQYVHERKLVHRDVKPENLLLGEQNEVLLSDFGVAIMAQSSRQSNLQTIGGTVAYMAPEQIQSKPGPASDQYSLGVVVYEWLTGERPFEGAFTEIATKQLLVAPPPLRDRVATLSQAIESVVLKALAKDPAERFTSVQGFAEALESAAQAGQPTLVQVWPTARVQSDAASATRLSPARVIPAEESLSTQALISSLAPASDVLAPSSSTTPSAPTEKTERAARTARRVSRRAVLGGIAGLSLAAGGLSWFALAQKAPTVSRPNSTPTLRLPTPTPLPATTLLTYTGHKNPVYAVAWSPDGKKVASAAGNGDLKLEPIDHSVQVWDALTGKTLVNYRGHSASVNGLAWSPDNKWLASASYDGTVQVWDAVVGGQPRLTYTGHTDHVWDVSWSPDGKYLASSGKDTTAQIWDAQTGSHILTYSKHKAGVSSVDWSPDSMRLLSGSYDTTVHIWDALSGTTRLIYHGHKDWVKSAVWSPNGKQVASGGGNNNIKLDVDTRVLVWDAMTGNLIAANTSHPLPVYAIIWSPDGKRIASGGGDNVVLVWDATNGAEIFAYGHHTNLLESLSWSPDGSRIVSGSDDTTAKIWAAG